MKVSLRVSDNPMDTIEIETSEDVAITLTESYSKEDNLARKWRSHHYSLDALDYEVLEYAVQDTPESILIDAETEAESSAWCEKALSLLTDVQRKRFLKYASGLSIREIARQEGADHTSVWESIKASRKKLKKFCKSTPTKQD